LKVRIRMRWESAAIRVGILLQSRALHPFAVRDVRFYYRRGLAMIRKQDLIGQSERALRKERSEASSVESIA
jgi:hypothetical protein